MHVGSNSNYWCSGTSSRSQECGQRSLLPQPACDRLSAFIDQSKTYYSSGILEGASYLRYCFLNFPGWRRLPLVKARQIAERFSQTSVVRVKHIAILSEATCSTHDGLGRTILETANSVRSCAQTARNKFREKKRVSRDAWTLLLTVGQARANPSELASWRNMNEGVASSILVKLVCVLVLGLKRRICPHGTAGKLHIVLGRS